MASIDKTATITPPDKPTWYTPDQVKLTAAADAGYAQVIQLNALQPEWFPEGTISFELKPSAFQGEARKPTAYDGMQSSLWSSRPQTRDTYGVTGGGVKEFLAGGVKAAGIVSAKATIPSADMLSQIQSAIRTARDSALNADPMLKKSIEHATNPKMKAEFEALIPNLTDQLIRGDLSFGSVPTAVRNLIHDVTKSTDLERKQPTKNKNPSGTGKRP